MQTPLEIILALSIISVYIACIGGVYTHMRSQSWDIASSISIAIPTTLAIYSTSFQAALLCGWSLIAIICSITFLVWSASRLYSQGSRLRSDFKQFRTAIKENRWIFTALIITVLYSCAQVLLLPVTNIDARTYHLPRIWLFIQENTFFLTHFTRYHEVIFPVGSDILFYPFLAFKLTHGLAIFGLTSYLSIGAATYSIARCYSKQKTSILCTLIMLSLTEIVLQSVSVKNDILMASVAAATLVIILKTEKPTYRRLLLLLCLCIFGVSIKTTFYAVLPGLFTLTVVRFKLWEVTNIRHLFKQARLDTKLTLALLIPLLIASQVWLYAWNTTHYDSWSGPEDFTHRHKQNDGVKGAIANSVRYGFHTIDSGFVLNQIIAPHLEIQDPTTSLLTIYNSYFEPYFKMAGSERGEFNLLSIAHEDYSWFGLLGALIALCCLPYAIYKQPKIALPLLPALLYFAIISTLVSWMIWNGRFMTTFFVTLTPALAYSLAHINRQWLYTALTALAISSLLTTKVIDFSRPILAVGKMASREIDLSIANIYDYSFRQGENIWHKLKNGNITNPGNPHELLNDIPQGAEVGLVGFGHLGHFNFYTARPDITWRPLNGSPETGEIDTIAAIGRFVNSDYTYCVIIGEMPSNIPYHLARHCADQYGHLITKQ